MPEIELDVFATFENNLIGFIYAHSEDDVDIVTTGC